MTTKVLTVEEITQLKEFKLQKEYLIVELKKIRQEETIISETLQKKYGDGSINLEKGEFISA